jgi:elongation factor Ts
MAITASLVKELRQRTGAGMMECKKALVEADGNIDTAIENMRKSGAAKADKKAGRIAAEGLIGIKLNNDSTQASIVEVNCETDFVTKGDDFQNFVNELADLALSSAPDSNESFLESKFSDAFTVDQQRKELIAKIGENINIRRTQVISGEQLGFYKHGSRIGVLVDLKGGNDALAKDIAMHVAASRPAYINATEIPQDVLDKETAIFTAQAQESGKPDNIIEKMVAGKIRKFTGEITLMGQAFVKDPDLTVEKLLKQHSAEVNEFIRFEVGEGIEKKSENFADEVMSQVAASE